MPLRQEVALRAGGGGGWRDHPEQVCYLVSSDLCGNPNVNSAAKSRTFLQLMFFCFKGIIHDCVVMIFITKLLSLVVKYEKQFNYLNDE